MRCRLVRCGIRIGPPFPGLEAFTEQDSVVFFGRDAESIIQKSTIEWRVDDLSDGHLAVFT